MPKNSLGGPKHSPFRQYNLSVKFESLDGGRRRGRKRVAEVKRLWWRGLIGSAVLLLVQQLPGLAWALWIHHNNKVHENMSQSAKELALYVLSFVQEYDGIHKIRSPQRNIDNACWIPLIASTFLHLFTIDPEMTKVKACEQTVLLARDLGFRKFQNISFVHVSRRCNRAAYMLAKDYGTSTTQMDWIEEVLVYVEEAVEDDRWWVMSSDY
ncbi:hypothetical protein V6N12_006917 [Hibiscus sabdariffa]|uniref:RNase H type-1 domain-containing protein n=1 Tax=Hibiscus sabdariffa TaxID=183260 RepID=A0ABR2F0A6_9ROSI